MEWIEYQGFDGTAFNFRNNIGFNQAIELAKNNSNYSIKIIAYSYNKTAES